jgi:hypothetical protein
VYVRFDEIEETLKICDTQASLTTSVSSVSGGSQKIQPTVPLAPVAAQHQQLTFEPFVAADVAACFVSIPRRRILELARSGAIPAHPLGEGQRRTWRFRLSELEQYLLSFCNPVSNRDKVRVAVSREIGGRNVKDSR